MTLSAAIPWGIDTAKGKILTFILPFGCNLKCAYCYIDQRREISHQVSLRSNDYVRFVFEAAERSKISAICVQGHEPLLDDAFVYTAEILKAGQELGIPTSVVTNGTALKSRIRSLENLRPAKLCVSLDSSRAEEHDRQRGVAGAFDSAVEGLRAAASSDKLLESLFITSVLIPKRSSQLIGMPSFLRDLGIENWVVNALVKVGQSRCGGPIGSHDRILENLSILQNEADRHQINMFVDDEFNSISTLQNLNGNDTRNAGDLRIQRLATPSDVVRLLPDGKCSFGIELLQQLAHDAPTWLPGKIHAADFINTHGKSSSMALAF